MLFLLGPVPLAPPSVRGAGSAVSRLAFAADAGGQSGLVLSAVAGIAPVLMEQMGAGARSHHARRRPELTARGTAPVCAPARSSSEQAPFCAVAHADGAGAAPSAPIGAWSAR